MVPPPSPDSDYSPGLGQVLVSREGPFRGTRSQTATSAALRESHSPEGSIASGSLRTTFPWSDEEDEFSGYASSSTVSSVQTRSASVNMADNNDDFRRHLEAKEQTSRAQQETLNNI